MDFIGIENYEMDDIEFMQNFSLITRINAKLVASSGQVFDFDKYTTRPNLEFWMETRKS